MEWAGVCVCVCVCGAGVVLAGQAAPYPGAWPSGFIDRLLRDSRSLLKREREREEWREWSSILTGRFLSVAALCLFRSTTFLGENVSHESQNGTWILTKATSKVRKRLGLYTTVSVWMCVWMCVWGMLTQSINDSTGQGSTRGSVTALPALLVWGRNLISLGVRPAHVLGTRLGIDSGL